LLTVGSQNDSGICQILIFPVNGLGGFEMKKVMLIILIICLMLIASIAWSEIVYVNDETGDDTTGERGNPDEPFKTIQAGINAALDDDTVLVADGEYKGDGNKDLKTNRKKIIVTSENGPEHTIINCEGDKRAFTFYNTGEGPDTIISGFTLTGGGNKNTGGAIHCGAAPVNPDPGSPTITNNIITGNNSIEGGGAIICNKGASPVIIDNIITGNSAGALGGGILCNEFSNPIITGNLIENNKAGQGSGNRLSGGGIFCETKSSPEITHNLIIGNEAPSYGGGIGCNDESHPKIINNIIAENSAGEWGGGIFSGETCLPEIIYNTILGNSAVNEGGGIYCYQGSAPTVLNSILWNNESPDNLEIGLWPGASITVDYSDVENGTGEDWFELGEGNIDINPLLDTNYHLTDYSPCISAGTDTPDITDDIDGELRPQPDGSNPDMGADENHRETSLPLGDVSGNESVTAFDASLTLQHVVGLINLSEGQPSFPNGADVGADVTGNKIVSALDAAWILQYTVGIILTFPAETGAAPILNAKSESKLLSDAISTLEKISLDREQEEVVKQLKSWLVSSILPTHTTLLQNYPNPFNPETWLPYQLAQDAYVTIDIYDTKGQLVRSFYLGMKQAGSYVMKGKAAYWDGRDNFGQKLASGVYFYTLQVHRNPDPILRTGKYTETRRMIILK